MKTRFYYTLAETMKLSEDATQFSAIDKPYFMDLVMDPSSNPIGGLGLYINTILDQNNLFTDDQQTKTVMKKYIWPMFYREKVMYIDVEHDSWETPTKPLVTSDVYKEALKEYGGKVWAWANDVYAGRYQQLLSLYNAQLSNLLNPVKTTSVSKFNDTPQIDSVSGYLADNYTSNVSQNTVSSDGATVMARLDEIRQNLHSVYGEWAKEFSAFVIEE